MRSPGTAAVCAAPRRRRCAGRQPVRVGVELGIGAQDLRFDFAWQFAQLRQRALRIIVGGVLRNHEVGHFIALIHVAPNVMDILDVLSAWGFSVIPVMLTIRLILAARFVRTALAVCLAWAAIGARTDCLVPAVGPIPIHQASQHGIHHRGLAAAVRAGDANMILRTDAQHGNRHTHARGIRCSGCKCYAVCDLRRLLRLL